MCTSIVSLNGSLSFFRRRLRVPATATTATTCPTVPEDHWSTVRAELVALDAQTLTVRTSYPVRSCANGD
jgi:hypothetical protein